MCPMILRTPGNVVRHKQAKHPETLNAAVTDFSLVVCATCAGPLTYCERCAAAEQFYLHCRNGHRTCSSNNYPPTRWSWKGQRVRDGLCANDLTCVAPITGDSSLCARHHALVSERTRKQRLGQKRLRLVGTQAIGAA